MSTLTITGIDKPLVQLSPDALHVKMLAISACNDVKAVENELDLEISANVLRDVAKLTKDCEAARVKIKAPVLDLARQIDDVAKTYSRDLEFQSGRIRSLVGSYHARKEEEQRAAERKRQEELARIERERVAAEAKAKREADEALKAAASPEQAEAAVVTAEAEVKRVTVESAQQIATVPQVPRVAAIAGVSVKSVWVFEVVDIDELHKHNPQFITLTHKAREINAAISAGHRSIPGLRIWEEKGVKVRA